MGEKGGWIAVDLDGTLAEYHGFKGETVIGEPIQLMVGRVQMWLNQGRQVRIFTARIGGGRDDPDRSRIVEAVKNWCFTHIGQKLPVVCCKDFDMIELWDDRCVQVETNTGRLIGRSREHG